MVYDINKMVQYFFDQQYRIRKIAVYKALFKSVKVGGKPYTVYFE